MEAKYTKGEWKNENSIIKCGNIVVGFSANVYNPDIEEQLSGESWMDMRKRTKIFRDEAEIEMLANAKLIAAAPKMVDALLKVVQTYNIGSKVNGMPTMTLALAEAICNAETVLKEATE